MLPARKHLALFALESDDRKKINAKILVFKITDEMRKMRNLFVQLRSRFETNENK